MTSRDKIEALSAAMLRTDEQFDGLLGLVQMAIALEKSGMGLPGIGPVSIVDGLSGDVDELDEQLLSVAAFVMWLRSDDAPQVDGSELVGRMPAEIDELARAAGLVG